jgi:hypothetical protein
MNFFHGYLKSSSTENFDVKKITFSDTVGTKMGSDTDPVKI